MGLCGVPARPPHEREAAEMTEHAEAVRNYLKQYEECKFRLQRLRADVENTEHTIREHLEPLLSFAGTGQAAADTRRLIARCRTDQRRVTQDIRKTESTMTEIVQTVDSCLEGAARDIIRLRYIDGMTWRHIAPKVNYCEDQCFRICKAALQAIQIPS